MYEASFAEFRDKAVSVASDTNGSAPVTKGWVERVGFFISFALLVAVALQLQSLNLSKVWAMVPTSPIFWLVFATYYLAAPATEWVIYHRLWRIPAEGFVALLRKAVSNELLLGYLGEVQFYSWARQRTAMTGAPFGTIKDVTILSALTGNVATLFLLALAWPLIGATQIGVETRTAFLSLGVVAITSMAILLFRRRLFSLPKADLRWITCAHFIRIALCLGLSALMWHLALPTVALSAWAILATLRMLISRLPLIPNKDVIFAGLAAFLLGHDLEIARLMAMMAGLLVATHIGVGLVSSLADFAPKRVAA